GLADVPVAGAGGRHDDVVDPGRGQAVLEHDVGHGGSADVAQADQGDAAGHQSTKAERTDWQTEMTIEARIAQPNPAMENSMPNPFVMASVSNNSSALMMTSSTPSVRMMNGSEIVLRIVPISWWMNVKTSPTTASARTRFSSVSPSSPMVMRLPSRRAARARATLLTNQEDRKRSMAFTLEGRRQLLGGDVPRR